MRRTSGSTIAARTRLCRLFHRSCGVRPFFGSAATSCYAMRMKQLKAQLAKHFSWVGPCVKFFSIIGGIGAAVYLVALLKLGQFTFVQHVIRIWKTPEVTDLRHGIATKLSSTHDNAMRGIRVKLATTRDPGADDAR